MTISKGLYIFLGNVLLANSLFAEKLETKLTPLQIEPGERAFYDLRLIAPPNDKGEIDAEIYVSDDFLLQHKKLKVLDKKFIKEEGIPTFRYELTAYNAEELRIPPIQVKWGGDQLSTESVILTVKSSRPETDQQMREAFDTVSKPWPLWRIARLGILALFTYFLCWLLWPYLQKLPGLIPDPKRFIPPPKEEDPVYWLKSELDKLKRKSLEEENNPDLVDDWFRIVKTYFAKKEKKTVRAWTTGEFKKNLDANPQAVGVLPLLKVCDEVKFSNTKHSSHPKLIENWILETERILLCGN